MPKLLFQPLLESSDTESEFEGFESSDSDYCIVEYESGSEF